MRNLIFALILIFPMSMSADVEIHETYSNSFGFVGTRGTRTIYIKGDMKRVDESYTMTGKFAMMMSKGKVMKTIRITDLRRGCIYDIDPEKGIYSKIDIGDIKSLDSSDLSDSIKALFKYEVKDKKEHKIINGFKAEHYIATMWIISEDGKDTLKISDDMWMSKSVPEYKTIKNNSWITKSAFMEQSNGKEMKFKYIRDFYKKIYSVQGYPIKAQMSMIASVNDETDGENKDTKPDDLLASPKADTLGNTIILFKSETEVKSIEKKQLKESLFKIRDNWKSEGR